MYVRNYLNQTVAHYIFTSQNLALALIFPVCVWEFCLFLLAGKFPLAIRENESETRRENESWQLLCLACFSLSWTVQIISARFLFLNIKEILTYIHEILSSTLACCDSDPQNDFDLMVLNHDYILFHQTSQWLSSPNSYYRTCAVLVNEWLLCACSHLFLGNCGQWWTYLSSSDHSVGCRALGSTSEQINGVTENGGWINTNLK